MGNIKIDLSQFKHLKSDDKSTTLQHKDGHVITLAHKPLSKDNQEALKSLSRMPKEDQTVEQANESNAQAAQPQMAQSGKIQHFYDGGGLSLLEQAGNYIDNMTGNAAKAKIPYQSSKPNGGDSTKTKERPEGADPSKSAGENENASIGNHAKGGTVKRQYLAEGTPEALQPNIQSEQPQEQDLMNFNADKPMPAPIDEKMSKAQFIADELNNTAILPSPANPSTPIPGMQKSNELVKPGQPLPSWVSPQILDKAAAKWDNMVDDKQADARVNAQKSTQAASLGFPSGDDQQSQDPAQSQAPSQAAAAQSQAPQQAPPSNGGPFSAQINPNDPFGAQQGLEGTAAGLNQQNQAIQAKAAADIDMGRRQASVDVGNIQQQYAMKEEFERNTDDANRDISDTIKDIKANYIKPNHYYENLSVPQKVSTAIGLLLGGIAGQGKGNVALDWMNRQIDRDIQAQQSKLNEQHTILGAYQNKYHNQQVAMDMARAAQNHIYASQLDQAAMENKNPQAQAAALMASGQLKQQGSQLIQKAMGDLTMSQFRQRALMGEQGPGGQNMDPATAVPLLVPPDRQKEAFEEIKNAQNVTKNGPKIMDAFNKAADTINGTDFVPGMENRYQKSLHQLLLPNFKPIDGSVRQAAMDETFKNITPQFGDNKATIDAKRKAVQDWMTSESAAPTAKGFGINLGNYKSSNEQMGSPVQHKNGHTYQLGSDGNYHKVK